jgi:phosphoribosylformylglycinamidine synthase
MGQLVGCIQGIGEACAALGTPVVSGNVSLYNETNGKGIPPTPVIGAVGLVDDIAETTDTAFKSAGEAIILIGETRGHLGASIFLRDLTGRREGPAPPVDLAAEKRNGDLVRGLIRGGRISACHDLSDGGLAVAVAEMALAGNLGAEVEAPENAGQTPLHAETPLHAWLFGEDQARYLVTTTAPEALFEAARAAGVPASRIGVTGGSALTLPGGAPISLDELRAAHEGWLPRFMGD